VRGLAVVSLVLGLASAAPTAGAADGWGAAANRICVRAFADARAYEKRVGTDMTTDEAIQTAHLKVAATAAARRDLARLRRPPAQRARIAQLLREVDILTAIFSEVESSLRDGNQARFQAYAMASIPHSRKANALSRALGATACADA